MTEAPQRTALRRTALAGVALAALGLTAACGGASSDAASTADDPSSSASSTSAGAAGSTASPGASIDQAAVKKLFADAMSSATTAHVEMSMTGQMRMSGSGDMDLRSKPMKADLTLTSSSLGGGDIEVLMADDAMYLHMAQLGDKYVKVPLTGKDSPLGQMGLSSLDPSSMLATFGDAFSGGTYVDKETVDGTATNHYRLTIDTKAITSALPSPMAGAASAMPATETVDVWLDGSGRYRQMKMNTGGETVTESFSDWGKPVSVKAPPASKVQDMSGMVSGLTGSQGS